MTQRHEGEEARIRLAYVRYDLDRRERAKRDHTNPGNRAIERERDQLLRMTAQRSGMLPLGARRLLEVGCGSGEILGRLAAWGAEPEQMVGVDLLETRIAGARLAHPRIHFETVHAGPLPFPNRSFDFGIACTLFSSILDDDVAADLASEIRRVLKPGARILWYDSRYSNPGNPDVRGVTQADLRQLFPGATLDLRTVTVLPPLVRRLGPLTDPAYNVLRLAPPLRIRYLGVITLPE